jgi:hypothetical protein
VCGGAVLVDTVRKHGESQRPVVPHERCVAVVAVVVVA